MLNDSAVTANVPAADLERARAFYADTLGVTPMTENPGGLIFKTGAGTYFFLYQTEYAGQAGHTIAQFHVADVAAQVAALKAKGLTFEHYDVPGVTWEGDVATVPEMGSVRGSRTARATSCASTTRSRARFGAGCRQGTPSSLASPPAGHSLDLHHTIGPTARRCGADRPRPPATTDSAANSGPSGG